MHFSNQFGDVSVFLITPPPQRENREKCNKYKLSHSLRIAKLLVFEQQSLLLHPTVNSFCIPPLQNKYQTVCVMFPKNKFFNSLNIEIQNVGILFLCKSKILLYFFIYFFFLIFSRCLSICLFQYLLMLQMFQECVRVLSFSSKKTTFVTILHVYKYHNQLGLWISIFSSLLTCRSSKNTISLVLFTNMTLSTLLIQAVCRTRVI